MPSLRTLFLVTPMLVGCASAWLVAVPLAAGQPVTAEYHPQLERLGSEHGLSHNAVYAILQDQLGFLWFGTQDGLNRYDGRDFVVHKHDPTDAATLSSSWVTALLEDRSGSLWIGTVAGLNRRRPDGTGFEIVHLPVQSDGESSSAVPVTALAEGPDGTVWVATERGLFRIDSTRALVRRFRGAHGSARSLTSSDVSALELDDDGTLWVLTHGLGLQATLHRFASEVQRWPVPFTRAFHFSEPDDVWVDARRAWPLDGLGDLDARVDASAAPTAYLEDAEHRLWIGTFQGLFLKGANDEAPRRIATAPSGEHSLTDEVHTILEDRAGGIWIGTYGGVLRFDPHRKAFRHLAHRPGDAQSLASSAVSAVHQDAAGHIWVGSYGAGLDRIDPATGQITHYRHQPGNPASLCGDYVWSVAPAMDRLWIGTSTGLCSLEHTGEFQARAFPRELDQPRIMRESPDGTLWIGTARGLYLHRPDGQTERRRLWDGREVEPSVDAMHVAPNGDIWVGSGAADHIARYDPAVDRVTVYPDIVEEGVWDIHADGLDRLWLATGDGLIRFDPASGTAERIRPAEGDEPGSVYYSLVADLDGRLWAGTNKGLVRHDPDDRDARFKHYDLSDGLGSIEFNRHAAMRNEAGELLFGGMSGLTIFHPSELHDNPHVPPIALTAVGVMSRGGERTLDGAGLEALTVSWRDYTLSFEFAALDFTQPSRNRYAYMLEGFDGAWIQAGTRPFARYTSLPAGRYVFRARGSNNDGLWNNEGVALPVRVLPPFWQTWWFRSTVLLAVVGLLGAAHRLRIRRLLDLERMRLRIAADLHDEVGSELSGIAIVSSTLGRQAQLTDKERRRLTELSTSASGLMERLRDVVWYINPEHDTLQSMRSRMRAVAATLLTDVAYGFESGFTGTDTAVPMELRRNVFLIYKELLHNIVRHAKATQVDIRFDVAGSKLRLEVADDGVGMVRDGTVDGSGLRSIRRRADQIGGDLVIDTKPGRGTRITVVVDMTRTRRGQSLN